MNNLKYLRGRPLLALLTLLVGLVAGLASLSVRATDLVTDAVARYSLAQGSGTTVFDAKGTHNATIYSGTWVDDAALGKVLRFNGTSTYVNIPDAADINTSTITQRSVSLWFKLDADADYTKPQILYEEGGAANGMSISLYHQRLFATGYNNYGWNGGTLLGTADTVTAATWHHVVLVLDGTGGTQALYLDGDLVGSGSGDTILGTGNDGGLGCVQENSSFTHDGLTIGPATTGENKYYIGEMSDLRIYNAVLSADEVTKLWSGDTSDHLKARWVGSLASISTTTTLVDEAGSSNGVLNGNATWDGDEERNTAIVLDGTADYVSIAPTTAVNAKTATRSVSLWFNADDITISSQRQVIFETGGQNVGMSIALYNGYLEVGSWNQLTSPVWLTQVSSSAIKSKRWHHVVVVVDGSLSTLQVGAFRVYLDGAPIGNGSAAYFNTSSEGGGIGAVVEHTRANGSTVTGTGTKAFAGAVTDVQIFDIPLTPRQAQSLASPSWGYDIGGDELPLQGRRLTSDYVDQSYTTGIEMTDKGAILLTSTWNTIFGQDIKIAPLSNIGAFDSQHDGVMFELTYQLNPAQITNEGVEHYLAKLDLDTYLTSNYEPLTVYLGYDPANNTIYLNRKFKIGGNIAEVSYKILDKMIDNDSWAGSDGVVNLKLRWYVTANFMWLEMWDIDLNNSPHYSTPVFYGPGDAWMNRIISGSTGAGVLYAPIAAGHWYSFKYDNLYTDLSTNWSDG